MMIISDNEVFMISTLVYPWTNQTGLVRNYRGEQEAAEAELACQRLRGTQEAFIAYPKVAKISQRTT